MSNPKRTCIVCSKKVDRVDVDGWCFDCDNAITGHIHWLLESKKPGDDGRPLYITHLYKDGVESGFTTTSNWYNAIWFETRKEAQQARKKLSPSQRKQYRPQQHTMSSNHGMRKVPSFAQKVVDKFKGNEYAV